MKILEQVRLEGTALQARRRLQLEVLPPDPLRFAQKVLGDEVRRVDNQPDLRVVDQDEELAVVGAICNGKRWSMNQEVTLLSPSSLNQSSLDILVRPWVATLTVDHNKLLTPRETGKSAYKPSVPREGEEEEEEEGSQLETPK